MLPAEGKLLEIHITVLEEVNMTILINYIFF